MASRRSATTKSDVRRNWSKAVTRKSNALNLEPRVFALDDPKRIAISLKTFADESRRRKGTSYQSAMSMLSFYINRAGRNLTAERRRMLIQAKRELRKL